MESAQGPIFELGMRPTVMREGGILALGITNPSTTHTTSIRMAHAHSSHDDHAGHVNDTLPVRILAILAALIIIAGIVGLTHAMGWHKAAASAISGILGTVLGAGGTSAHAPTTAAFLGWCGPLVLLFGVLVFVGAMNFLF